MPRKYKSFEHLLEPDPVYGDYLFGKIINCIMKDGKKSIAQKLFYRTLEIIKNKVPDKNPEEVVKQAVENVKPKVELKPRRVGGATYQVPVEVEPKRQQSLAIRWLVKFAREKKGKPFAEKFAEEIIAAYKGEGSAIKKRDETHKMAEANRAFARYAW
jgi:small subunit ribosomal protein S7